MKYATIIKTGLCAALLSLSVVNVSAQDQPRSGGTVRKDGGAPAPSRGGGVYQPTPRYKFPLPDQTQRAPAPTRQPVPDVRHIPAPQQRDTVWVDRDNDDRQISKGDKKRAKELRKAQKKQEKAAKKARKAAHKAEKKAAKGREKASLEQRKLRLGEELRERREERGRGRSDD